MDQFSVPAPIIVALVAIYYLASLVKGYIARKNITLPSAAKAVLDKLGGQTLIDAYYKAEQEATEPNIKRDIAASYIKAAAQKIGLSVSTSTINLLIEFIVNIINHEGPDSANSLARTYPGQ